MCKQFTYNVYNLLTMLYLTPFPLLNVSRPIYSVLSRMFTHKQKKKENIIRNGIVTFIYIKDYRCVFALPIVSLRLDLTRENFFLFRVKLIEYRPFNVQFTLFFRSLSSKETFLFLGLRFRS